MSSLDHNLVVGNSLTGIGTIDEVLDVLEPQRRPGQASFFADEIRAALEVAKERLMRAAPHRRGYQGRGPGSRQGPRQGNGGRRRCEGSPRRRRRRPPRCNPAASRPGARYQGGQ